MKMGVAAGDCYDKVFSGGWVMELSVGVLGTHGVAAELVSCSCRW